MPSELISHTATKETISQHLSKMRIHKSADQKDSSNKMIGVTGSNSASGSGGANSFTPACQEETKFPVSFEVKYLGKKEARGLWGIKHTRKPVDDMVAAAR